MLSLCIVEILLFSLRVKTIVTANTFVLKKSAVTYVCTRVYNKYFLLYIVGILLFSLSCKNCFLLLIPLFPQKSEVIPRPNVAKPDYVREP